MTHDEPAKFGCLWRAGRRWVALIAWQTAEHARVRRELLKRLPDRGRYESIGLRQAHALAWIFRGVITKERLEDGLNALVITNDLLAIELLNNSGQPVASAGPHVELPPRE